MVPVSERDSFLSRPGTDGSNPAPSSSGSGANLSCVAAKPPAIVTRSKCVGSFTRTPDWGIAGPLPPEYAPQRALGAAAARRIPLGAAPALELGKLNWRIHQSLRRGGLRRVGAPATQLSRSHNMWQRSEPDTNTVRSASRCGRWSQHRELEAATIFCAPSWRRLLPMLAPLGASRIERCLFSMSLLTRLPRAICKD
jgi:hypothetical protein